MLNGGEGYEGVAGSEQEARAQEQRASELELRPSQSSQEDGGGGGGGGASASSTMVPRSHGGATAGLKLTIANNYFNHFLTLARPDSIPSRVYENTQWVINGLVGLAYFGRSIIPIPALVGTWVNYPWLFANSIVLPFFTDVYNMVLGVDFANQFRSTLHAWQLQMATITQDCEDGEYEQFNQISDVMSWMMAAMGVGLGTTLGVNLMYEDYEILPYSMLPWFIIFIFMPIYNLIADPDTYDSEAWAALSQRTLENIFGENDGRNACQRLGAYFRAIYNDLVRLGGHITPVMMSDFMALFIEILGTSANTIFTAAMFEKMAEGALEHLEELPEGTYIVPVVEVFKFILTYINYLPYPLVGFAILMFASARQFTQALLKGSVHLPRNVVALLANHKRSEAGAQNFIEKYSKLLGRQEVAEDMAKMCMATKRFLNAQKLYEEEKEDLQRQLRALPADVEEGRGAQNGDADSDRSGSGDPLLENGAPNDGSITQNPNANEAKREALEKQLARVNDEITTDADLYARLKDLHIEAVTDRHDEGRPVSSQLTPDQLLELFGVMYEIQQDPRYNIRKTEQHELSSARLLREYGVTLTGFSGYFFLLAQSPEQAFGIYPWMVSSLSISENAIMAWMTNSSTMNSIEDAKNPYKEEGSFIHFFGALKEARKKWGSRLYWGGTLSSATSIELFLETVVPAWGMKGSDFGSLSFIGIGTSIVVRGTANFNGAGMAPVYEGIVEKEKIIAFREALKRQCRPEDLPPEGELASLHKLLGVVETVLSATDHEEFEEVIEDCHQQFQAKGQAEADEPVEVEAEVKLYDEDGDLEKRRDFVAVDQQGVPLVDGITADNAVFAVEAAYHCANDAVEFLEARLKANKSQLRDEILAALNEAIDAKEMALMCCGPEVRNAEDPVKVAMVAVEAARKAVEAKHFNAIKPKSRKDLVEQQQTPDRPGDLALMNAASPKDYELAVMRLEDKLKMPVWGDAGVNMSLAIVQAAFGGLVTAIDGNPYSLNTAALVYLTSGAFGFLVNATVRANALYHKQKEQTMGAKVDAFLGELITSDALSRIKADVIKDMENEAKCDGKKLAWTFGDRANYVAKYVWASLGKLVKRSSFAPALVGILIEQLAVRWVLNTVIANASFTDVYGEGKEMPNPAYNASAPIDVDDDALLLSTMETIPMLYLVPMIAARSFSLIAACLMQLAPSVTKGSRHESDGNTMSDRMEPADPTEALRPEVRRHYSAMFSGGRRMAEPAAPVSQAPPPPAVSNL